MDDEASEHTKARYKFPYGDFERVHRCGLNAAEVRAARQKYLDIEDAAAVNDIFEKLMGSDVDPRKKFIQAHAKSVRNLDV